jgi:hypothetical protein
MDDLEIWLKIEGVMEKQKQIFFILRKNRGCYEKTKMDGLEIWLKIEGVMGNKN